MGDRLAGMTRIPPQYRRRALGWGVAATVVAGLGILGVGIVLLLAATIDPNYGWLLFVALPAAVMAGAVASVLGIVGVVFARADGSGYAWPIAGIVLGVGQLLGALGLLSGWFA